MMNILKRIGIVIVVTLVSISCSDYLSQVPDDRLTLDDAFEQRSHVEDFLANIYSRLPHDTQRFAGGNNGPWTGASDEAEFVWPYYDENAVHRAACGASSGHVSEMWPNHNPGRRPATDFIA